MFCIFFVKQKTAYEMLRSLVCKQKTAYEMLRSLVGSEMCIRDRPNRAVNHTGVDRHARARRRLKVHVITGEFDHHKRAIGIESLRRDRRGRQIAGAQRSGCPFNEVVDALLRTYPLEYMVMAGK